MTNHAAEYEARWKADLASAEAATLPSDREKFMRSAKQWRMLADQQIRAAEVSRSEVERIRRQAAR